MLLQLTSSDMLNTCLVEVSTGQTLYKVATVLIQEGFIDDSKDPVDESLCNPLNGASCFSSSSSCSLSKAYDTPTTCPPRYRSSSPIPTTIRRTQIHSDVGILVADIIWRGRRPDITFIGQDSDSHIQTLSQLFNTSNAKIIPNTLAIPSRFDPNLVWTATANSLALIASDSSKFKGAFHQSCVRFHVPSRSSSKAPQSRLSKSSSNPNPQSLELIAEKTKEKVLLLNTHVPGLGHSYLEFDTLECVADVELIVSFFMMEIIRRGRFSQVTPYIFDRPKLWPLVEMKDLVLRKIQKFFNRAVTRT